MSSSHFRFANAAWFALLAGWVLLAPAARSQILKMGPIDVGLSLNFGADYTTNYDGLPDDEDPEEGDARDDFYITYGLSLSGSTKLYPEIDLTLSSSISREKHFIQEEPVEDDVPLLGNSSFNLNRSRGRYGFNFGLRHSADTDYKKEEVFIPAGRRKSRDLTQTSSLQLGMNWNYSPLQYSANYNYIRERHSENFKDGDKDSQSFGFNSTYQIIKTVRGRFTYDRTKDDVLNVEDDPADNIWEQTMFVGFDVDILQRPSLRYTVGGEREDDLGEKGKWEPQHTVTFADNRQFTPSVSGGINATYSFEREEESDDVSFTYGANLRQSLPYRFSHGVTASREPVSTFGSTSVTDSTTLGYNLSHPSFFVRDLSMNFSTNYSLDKPQGAEVQPSETTLDYSFSLTRSIQLSKSWNGVLSYIATIEDREIDTDPVEQATITEHRITLNFSYTVF